MGDEHAGRLPESAVDEAVSFRAYDHDDLSARGWRARGAHADRQPEHRSDARVHRVPSLLPVDGLATGPVDALARGALALAARGDPDSDRRDGADRPGVPE